MKKYPIIALLVILFTSPCVFANGVALTGVGARATVLAGAYRALSDDWSGMYWNPAGLTQIRGLHIGFSNEICMPRAHYSAYGLPLSTVRPTEMKNNAKTFHVPDSAWPH